MVSLPWFGKTSPCAMQDHRKNLLPLSLNLPNWSKMSQWWNWWHMFTHGVTENHIKKTGLAPKKQKTRAICSPPLQHKSVSTSSLQPASSKWMISVQIWSKKFASWETTSAITPQNRPSARKWIVCHVWIWSTKDTNWIQLGKYILFWIWFRKNLWFWNHVL